MLMSFVTRHTTVRVFALVFEGDVDDAIVVLPGPACYPKTARCHLRRATGPGKSQADRGLPRALSREYPRLLGSLEVHAEPTTLSIICIAIRARDSPTCRAVFDVIELFQNRHWNHDSMFRENRNRRRIVQQHVGVEYISLHTCRSELR